MKTPELVNVLPVHNELGEGVIWDASRGAVWWTDIESRLIYRYQLETKHLEHWATPQQLGCFAPVAGKDYLIAAFESGFAYYDPPSGHVEWLHRIEKDTPHTRLNDGRTDRQGRFWAGSMVEKGRSRADAGALYCLDQQLRCSSKILGLSISNGFAGARIQRICIIPTPPPAALTATISIANPRRYRSALHSPRPRPAVGPTVRLWTPRVTCGMPNGEVAR